jgi:homoserine/homoserine lactone efflux protein
VSFAAWFGFLLAAILIAVTPGPGAVLSMSTGASHGYWAAFSAILGLQLALLIHLTIVAVGLGALLATSEAGFVVLKFIGAGYLVWLGVERWRAPALAAAELPLPPRQSLAFFRQGLLVNLTNPKAIVFICALVPPFIDPAQPLAPQYLVIAATMCLTDVLVMSAYALAAARLGRWLHDPRAVKFQNRAFGTLFVLAGTLLAASSRGS